MNIKDIKEGKTFYRLKITSAGQIYELNKVTVVSIIDYLGPRFGITYTTSNPTFTYSTIYENIYVTTSDSPYFIKMGAEEYLTLPNKQALMKAVRAQIMKYSTYPQSKPKTVINYRLSMRKIKQLH